MHDFYSDIKYFNRIRNNNSDVLLSKQQQKIKNAKMDKLIVVNSLDLSTQIKIEKIKFHPSFFATWEINTFDSDLILREDTPLIKNKWETISLNKNLDKNIQGYIYRSKDRLNMKTLSVKIQTLFTLRADSTLWIFNRVIDYFDEYTVSIKIEKIENSQKVFCSLGTFIRDKENNLIFRNFLREQLVDYSTTNTGDDKVIVRLFMNESDRENIICGNFFIPICENRRVMAAGTGLLCHIKSLTLSNVDLEELKEEEKIFSYDDGINQNMTNEDENGELRRPCCCFIF